MALRSVWRRLTARKHKRSSFYESQDVMRRAIEAETAERRKRAPCASPDDKETDGQGGRRRGS